MATAIPSDLVTVRIATPIDAPVTVACGFDHGGVALRDAVVPSEFDLIPHAIVEAARRQLATDSG